MSKHEFADRLTPVERGLLDLAASEIDREEREMPFDTGKGLAAVKRMYAERSGAQPSIAGLVTDAVGRRTMSQVPHGPGVVGAPPRDLESGVGDPDVRLDEGRQRRPAQPAAASEDAGSTSRGSVAVRRTGILQARARALLAPAFILVAATLTGMLYLLWSLGSGRLHAALIPGVVVLTVIATTLAGDSFRRLPPRDRKGAVEGRSSSIRDRAVIAAKVPVPAMLPVGPEPFHGRVRELQELADWREAARAAAERRPVEGGHARTDGALLMIHGRPGVGKSALALEYAHRIATEHPGGVLYANLDNAGNPRPPAEVLKSFLRELGWTGAIPTNTGRHALFRSLMAKRRRVLVVLDAASHADQVLPFVPTVPDCTVVVTSRRDLRPAISAQARSLYLDVPSPVDAAEILRASARTEVDRDRLSAAEIVHLCGRLPFALRSAGEQAAEHPHRLAGVVDQLRPEQQRLDRLRFRGRDLRREFDLEYRRLTEREQIAFRRLALVRSTTFLPWVLQPLMDVGRDEAEHLIAGLHRAQLLDLVTGAVPSGLTRYRFHPLILLFAREIVDNEPESDLAEARTRLNAAYLEAIERVIFGDEARSGTSRAAGRLTQGGAWLESVRNVPDEWVRAEYPSLVECVLAAAGDDPALCWRIAERLGECVPYDSDDRTVLGAFAAAYAAATRDHFPHGITAVAVARGSYLVGIERYDEGIAMLASAVADAEAASPDDTSRLLALRGRRHIAEAYLQMGAYEKAAAYLDEDLAEKGPWPIQRELRVIDMLRAEVLVATSAQQSQEQKPFYDALTDFDDDYIAYRAHLNLAQAQSRRREWSLATDHLRQAAALHGADARRAASVAYRTARLWLAKAKSPGTDSSECASQAARHAVEAVVTFQRINNPVGAIRAGCLLTRALVVAGDLEQAEEQLQRCRVVQRSLAPTSDDAISLIAARIRRAEGELALAREDYVRADAKLRGTAQIFETHGDAGSAAEIRRLIGNARGHLGSPHDAVDGLWHAASYYHQAGDYATLHEITVELFSATHSGPDGVHRG